MVDRRTLGQKRPSELLILYDTYQQQMSKLDVQIELCLDNLETKTESEAPAKKGQPRKKPPGNQPNFDRHQHLYRISGVDFTQIDGLNVLTVQTIISEVGLDPTRFPTVKHFCSWLGLCPGAKISGGKAISTQTRKVLNRAANAFRLVALLCSERSPLIKNHIPVHLNSKKGVSREL